MSRKLKEYIVNDLERSLELGAGFVVIDFKGLSSEATFDLRKNVRAAGGHVRVVPNRLARRVIRPALGEALAEEGSANGGQDLFRQMFTGPTAVVTAGESAGDDEVIALSRTLAQWRKKNDDKIAIKGGFVAGDLIDPDGMQRLASLPDRHTLLTQVAGLFQSGLRDTVSVMNQILARVVWALDAYREKLEKEQDDGGS